MHVASYWMKRNDRQLIQNAHFALMYTSQLHKLYTYFYKTNLGKGTVNNSDILTEGQETKKK